MKFEVAVSINDWPTPGRSGAPFQVYIEAADEGESRQFIIERFSNNGCAVQVHEVTAIDEGPAAKQVAAVTRNAEQDDLRRANAKLRVEALDVDDALAGVLGP